MWPRWVQSGAPQMTILKRCYISFQLQLHKVVHKIPINPVTWLARVSVPFRPYLLWHLYINVIGSRQTLVQWTIHPRPKGLFSIMNLSSLLIQTLPSRVLLYQTHIVNKYFLYSQLNARPNGISEPTTHYYYYPCSDVNYCQRSLLRIRGRWIARWNLSTYSTQTGRKPNPAEEL